ncbi:MAG TPA: putative metal-binding motif-containing protein, partial [Polyangiaceae bacterium]|nr:putative metal-binding motif-containing protein [Polyangiaceae bacterium]
MKVLGPAHVLLTSATLALGCGSRTTLKWEEGPPPPPECLLDKDCEGFGDRCFPVACVEGKCEATPPVDCNDRNPCTSDVCDPNTGACAHPLATLDLDGDEHRSPLPGKRAGDPDSCGDDCDDTNPKALPGGAEICDGVDNDCNGIVDDRATLAPAGDAIKISDGTTRASPGSLAYAGGASFLGAYSGQVAKRDSVYLANLSPLVGRVGKANRFTTSPADAYGGPLAWTGDRFGIAWTDRRDARGSTINYEVYFNLVNPDGTKRTADVRLTHADYFSINVSMAWTGNQFVVVWQDDGLTKHDDNGIFAQRVDVNGAAIGGNVRLHEDDGRGQTAPAIAAGPRSLGVAWMHGDSQSHELVFAAFDYELAPLVKPVSLTGPMSPGVAATVYFNEDRFVILWYDPDGPNKTIF